MQSDTFYKILLKKHCNVSTAVDVLQQDFTALSEQHRRVGRRASGSAAAAWHLGPLHQDR